jgi:hypothetical protein
VYSSFSKSLTSLPKAPLVIQRSVDLSIQDAGNIALHRTMNLGMDVIELLVEVGLDLMY